MGLLMFSQNRGSAEQLAKAATSTQGKFLKLLLLMTVGLAVVFCVAYAMFGLAFPGGRVGGNPDVREGFDIADKSNSDGIAMEVVRKQMSNLAARGVSVCVQQCMSVAGPPCVEPGRGLEMRDADGKGKPPSGSERDGYPLLWQKVRSKAELGMEETEQRPNKDGAADRQGRNDAVSAHQAADHGASDRHATDHGASSDRQARRITAEVNGHAKTRTERSVSAARRVEKKVLGGNNKEPRREDDGGKKKGGNNKEPRREDDGGKKKGPPFDDGKKKGGDNKEPRREDDGGKKKGPPKGGRGWQNKEPGMMTVEVVEKFRKFVPPDSGEIDDVDYKLPQDDIDLLELAATKANYMPRVALLFLAEGPVRPAPVWENYLRGYEDLYSIYVHQMPRVQLPQNDSKLFAGRVIRSENGEWGSVDVVDAQRRLLANAIMNPLNQRFIFLSDSCVPVTDFLFMYHYLMDTGDSFVESAQAGEQYDVDAKGKAIVEREEPDVQFRFQWFALTRKHAALIVQDRTYYRAFAWNCVGMPRRTDGFCVLAFSRWCRRRRQARRFICDRHEQYIETVIRNLAYHELNQRSVMWASSQEGSWDAHAVSWTAEKLRANGSLLECIREQKNCRWNGQEKECFLFAHKFTSDAVPLLLEKGKQLGLWRS